MSKEATLWYTILLFSLFIIMATAWITFARLTMARIERDMKKDSVPEGFLWDGLGGRIFFYAFAIVFSESKAKRIDKLINVSLVRSYANHRDWHRGLIFIIASSACIFVTIAGFLFDAYK